VISDTRTHSDSNSHTHIVIESDSK